MKLFLASLILVIISCSQVPQRKQAQVPDASPLDPRSEKSLEQLSFSDLSIIMITLMGSVDDHPQACQWTQEQKAALPQMLQADLDARWESEKSTYLKKRNARQTFPANCIQNCSCHSYAAFFDYLKRTDVKLKKLEARIADQMTQDASAEAYLKSCQPQAWVCQSASVRAAIKSLE